MNKLERYAVYHDNVVIAVVGFSPFFMVFTPLNIVESFWQASSLVYILILMLIRARRYVLIERLEQQIQQFLDVHKGGKGLSNNLDERYNELTALSDDLDDAKNLYSLKLSSTLNSSVIIGLLLTLLFTFSSF